MTRVRMPGLLNGELLETARLPVLIGQYQLTADEPSQATLTIPEDGPVVKLRDWIALHDAAGLMGIYRVTNITQTVRRHIQLTLMHGIDVLADSHWAAETEYKGKPRGFLEAALNEQTALIDGVKPWQLGACEDTETDLDEKISYSRLSDVVPKAVQEGGDYQFEYDQSHFPWTMNLVRKPTAAACEFRLLRNITSATITYNDADLCTRLILSNTSGGESRVRVYDAGAAIQAEWGVVTKTASIDTNDDLDAASWPEAEAWVAAFFALHAAPSVQIQIEGRELYSLTGESWDRASLGRMCRVALPDYGHTFLERVVGITYPDPFGDPDRVVVSLANALPKFSETVKLLEKTAQSASRAAGGAARKADQTEAALDEHKVLYQAAINKTDREISGIASATGLQFNADGTPVVDENGEFVYSETHPDNALIAQIQLQAGRYDRIIQATGISETAVPGEVSLVTQVSQTHQQLSQAAIATGLVWDASLNEGAGGFKVDPNAISSSVYKQLAGQISAKVTASDVKTQVEAYGYLDLTAAKNAAAAEIGAQLDNGTSSISAKVKALVEGDTSLIQLVAQQVDVVSELASYSGDIELRGTLYSEGGFDTTGDSKFEGNLVIDGGNLNLINGAALQIGGTTINPVNSISLVPPTGTSTTFTLKYTDLGGTEHTVGTFSRAASIQTVSGSWSGSTYQIVADANGTALPLNETLTFTVGTTPSGGASSTTIDRFSSLHKNTLTVKGSSQPSAAYIKQYIIDASGVYSDGETAGRTQAVTDATLSVDAPFVLNGVIKIYPRVTFDADTEKSANPMDAQLPALATNSSGTPTAAPSTLVAGSTVYPYVQIGSVNFFGSAYTVPSSAAVNVESSHPHTMSANTETVTPSNGYDAMAQVVVDATPRYYAGKAAVVLSDTPTWGTTPSSNITAAQNTVTVSTSGRTNTSGTADERTKTINLYSNVTKSGLTATFYVTHTNSTDANRIIKREATFSDSNLTPENIKENVWIFGVKGSYTGSGGGGGDTQEETYVVSVKLYEDAGGNVEAQNQTISEATVFYPGVLMSDGNLIMGSGVTITPSGGGSSGGGEGGEGGGGDDPTPSYSHNASLTRTNITINNAVGKKLYVKVSGSYVDVGTFSNDCYYTASGGPSSSSTTVHYGSNYGSQATLVRHNLANYSRDDSIIYMEVSGGTKVNSGITLPNIYYTSSTSISNNTRVYW